MPHDPYKYFRVEARDLLDQLGSGTLDLEKGRPGAELVPKLLRLAHTLKGAARVVKQRETADLAHAIEETLQPYREAGQVVPREKVDRVLGLLDDIGRSLAAVVAQPSAEGSPAPAEPQDVFRMVRVDIGEVDELVDGVAAAHAHLGKLRQCVPDLGRARRTAEIAIEQFAARSREGARQSDGASEGRLRAMLDELHGTVRALDQSLSKSVEQIDGELRQIREAAESLQLVPASILFTPLERAARDVAQALGKRVAFHGKGGDVRLHAHVLEGIQPALAQAVRNAVAHGIEPESARKAAGKTPEGHVTLDVTRRGKQVLFSCRDDGRGLDTEAVKEALRRKGSLPAKEKEPGFQELIRLLLRGGISTSGTVTEVSGRGIGFDVIRESAEKLRGEISVRTEPGKGTSLEILVPLSLASLTVLLVEAAGVPAAIPLDAVRAGLVLNADQIARSPTGDFVDYEGRSIPFVPLARLLSRSSPEILFKERWSALVVEGESGFAAIGVDRMQRIGDVLIRPLPERAPVSGAVGGVSLDAEGNPELVLDPEGLVQAARETRTDPKTPGPARPPILVIDDSLTTRMLEQSILESAGYHVELASSGEEGLQKARSKTYGLFLVDIEMPGIDGFTFVERTRADPVLRNTPAILISSRDSPEDKRRGREAGAYGYMVKSEFDQAALIDHIRDLLD
jgi:two-component system chemotaxis sensor kinase CheA